MAIKVFVSYSHQDRDFLADNSLLGYLRGLEREGVEFWSDEAIGTGDKWDDEIRRRIQETDIALVLVSQWFLDSPYCTNVEISGFLQQCRDHGLIIFPVIISACEWKRHDWLSSRQFLPGANKTIRKDYTDRGSLEELFLRIREDLRRQIEKLRQPGVPEPPRSVPPFSETPEPDGPSTTKPAQRFRAVLFDDAHGQSEWRYVPPTVGRGYKRIAEITKQHCNLDVEVLGKGETICLEKLRKYVAFILPIGPQKLCYLNENELRAIKDYVNEGKGVLLLSTYTGDWHHEANLNQIAENYGVIFNRDVILQQHAADHDAWGQLYEGAPSSKYVVLAQPYENGGVPDGVRQELLEGVRKVKTLSSCSLAITNSSAATVILCSEPDSTIFEPEPAGRGIAIASYKKSGKGPVALIAASKAGKVVAVGSWKMFLDGFVEEADCDNGRLYENILRWLITPC